MPRKRKATDDWRKQKRAHDGSIRSRSGKVFARIQYFAEDGSRRDKERPAKNRKHAREVIKQMREELLQGGEALLDAHRMTFALLARAYEQARLFPAVIQNGKKIMGLRSYAPTKRFLVPLTERFSRKHIRTIKHADIQAYKVARLATPVRAGTDKKGKPIFRPRSVTCINRELALLRAMLNFAVENEWIGKSPFKKGGPLIAMTAEVQRNRVLTRDEESRLLAALAGRRAHLKPLVLTAVDTAMRRGELLKLKWSDVDFVGNVVLVCSSNTKTEKERQVGLTPRVRECLLSLRDSAPPDPNGSVFGLSDTSTIKTGWRSALKQAGIKDLHFHDLRHSAITRMIRAGIPTAEVMVASAHSQMSTFRRYLNPEPEAARAGAQLLAQYLERSQPEAISESVN